MGAFGFQVGGCSCDCCAQFMENFNPYEFCPQPFALNWDGNGSNDPKWIGYYSYAAADYTGETCPTASGPDIGSDPYVSIIRASWTDHPVYGGFSEGSIADSTLICKRFALSPFVSHLFVSFIGATGGGPGNRPGWFQNGSKVYSPWVFAVGPHEIIVDFACSIGSGYTTGDPGVNERIGEPILIIDGESGIEAEAVPGRYAGGYTDIYGGNNLKVCYDRVGGHLYARAGSDSCAVFGIDIDPDNTLKQQPFSIGTGEWSWSIQELDGGHPFGYPGPDALEANDNWTQIFGLRNYLTGGGAAAVTLYAGETDDSFCAPCACRFCKAMTGPPAANITIDGITLCANLAGLATSVDGRGSFGYLKPSCVYTWSYNLSACNLFSVQATYTINADGVTARITGFYGSGSSHPFVFLWRKSMSLDYSKGGKLDCNADQDLDFVSGESVFPTGFDAGLQAEIEGSTLQWRPINSYVNDDMVTIPYDPRDIFGYQIIYG